MTPYTFKIVAASDREYINAFEKLGAEGFVYERATLGEFGELPASEVQRDTGIQEVLAEGMRVFLNLSFHFADQISISITRSNESESLFDKVSISRPRQVNQIVFAKLVASVQKHLGQSSLLSIGNLLGPTARQHFEAREIALARLERMSSALLEEMESARKRREEEFEVKEKALEAKLEARQREIDATARVRQQEQDERAKILDTLQKELDDRAAKHARRQHYKEIKEKFKTWSETFQVTAGTTSLRSSVFWFTLSLLFILGGLAGYFLLRSFGEENPTLMISSIVKQVTFTILFVSTAYFFIRWNDQWFQRHANEEFRLKRMELDIDRASWFVEMAFEWKEEKGEEIPGELIERLTRGLFADNRAEHRVEPADSLANALIGAARFKVKLMDGTEAEYDRKGIEKLIRKSPKRSDD
jgi:hypothetical protein